MKDIKLREKDESQVSSASIALKNSFKERMELCAQRVGSVSALAKKAEISQSGIRRYFCGGEPTRPHLLALAEAAGVSLTWLATGQGTYEGATHPAVHSSSGEAEAVTQTTLGEEYALIPLYDMRAVAGHGALVDHEVDHKQMTDSLVFKRRWIHQELHANPSDLYLIHVDSESMEPKLRTGDMILVDQRNAQAVPRDGIYVLRMDGSLLVKRLQRLLGRKVKVISDNPAYEPFELSLDAPDENLTIIGRVVWTGQRI